MRLLWNTGKLRTRPSFFFVGPRCEISGFAPVCASMDVPSKNPEPNPTEQVNRTANTSVIRVYLDIETTSTRIYKGGKGTSKKVEKNLARVVQLGAVLCGPDRESVPFNSLCDPGVDIDQAAQRVHGIRKSECQLHPRLPVQFLRLCDFLDAHCPENSQRVLCSYNGHAFDLPVLVQHLLLDGVDPVKYLDKLKCTYSLDIMLLAAKLPGHCRPPALLKCGKVQSDPRAYKLTKLLEAITRAKVPEHLLKSTHDAVTDCKILQLICTHPDMEQLIAAALQGSPDASTVLDLKTWVRTHTQQLQSFLRPNEKPTALQTIFKKRKITL